MNRNLIPAFAIALIVPAVLGFGGSVAQAQEGGLKEAGTSPASPRHAVEVSPLSPLFRIYALQYGYALDEKNELLGGFAYSNIRYDAAPKERSAVLDLLITPNHRTYDIGEIHSYSLFVGYRRYLWRGFCAEYQLWPGYSDFYSKPEDRHYKGFDLWNELRVGYTINFHIARQAFVVDLQYILGFGLYRGNKPADFGSGESPLFRAPLVLVGAKF
jgi:hypothetical protein